MLFRSLYELEKQWPEYSSSTTMISRPEYLRRRDGLSHPVVEDARRWVADQTCLWAEKYLGKSAMNEAKDWVSSYLAWDVQRLQEHKQHHVHIYNDETEEKEPLQACRRKDNPKLCKADFPRTG